tara:strand:+ start:264 stop:1316 length:1053 start_codon:yes stop_codon:yes gene_type:complete
MIRPGKLKAFFSFIFFLFFKLNKLLYLYRLRRSVSFSSFILSVGNLSLGGSGKTPMVELLAKSLYHKNKRLAIISRGYGRSSWFNHVVTKGAGPLVSVHTSGDEPFMLAMSLKKIPIIVGKKIKSISMAIDQFQSKTIILDDSFQTHSIKRNLDVLLIDLSINIKQYNIFPKGYLREPVGEVNRADVIIFTKSGSNRKNDKRVKQIILNNLTNKKTLLFDAQCVFSLKKYLNEKKAFISYNKKINSPSLAFCGIANSDLFEKEAHLACSKKVEFLAFSDHCKYTPYHIQKIKNILIKKKVSHIITTKKDFFKIQEFFSSYEIFIIDLQHKIEKEEVLFSFINKQINKYYS